MVFEQQVDEQVDEKSTIVDFFRQRTRAEVIDKEETYKYSCGKQQEYGAHRRRAIGELHEWKAWRIMDLGTPERYFRERLGLGKARWYRIVQNDRTERELCSRLQGFEKEFVKDSFLEALRDYTAGEQLLLAQTMQQRRRFFTQKEVTRMAEELGYKKIVQRYGFKSSKNTGETELRLVPLDEDDLDQLSKVAEIDEDSIESTLCKASRDYAKRRLKA